MNTKVDWKLGGVALVLAVTMILTSGCYTTRRATTCCPSYYPPPAAPPAPPPAPPVKKRITLRGVNFDFDMSNIRPDARAILDEAVSILNENPEIDVVVEGHTDWRGSAEYNQALSMRRASSVRSYFVNHGIDAGRLRLAGYGELQPVATNDTDDGRAQNRRVELRVN